MDARGIDAIDASGLSVPIGQVGCTSVTVHCTVTFSDLLLPGTLGPKTLSDKFSSVADAYRSGEG
ncbi:hypothetical protein [Streptomyces sp. NPDC102409]|uniref:hypothetical protein n=1 Tax=Streptomyces sp. NPDC102409 TaxID=3366172 RepID=UPI00381897F2